MLSVKNILLVCFVVCLCMFIVSYVNEDKPKVSSMYPTPNPTKTPTMTIGQNRTSSPTPTPTRTVTPTIAVTPTVTVGVTGTVPPTPTGTVAPTPTPTGTVAPTGTVGSTPTIPPDYSNPSTLISIYKGGKKTGPFKSSDDTVVFRVDETTKEQYQEYIKTLKNVGFKSIISNQMQNNLYETLVRNNKLINISYIKASNRVIIVHETLGALPDGINKDTNNYIKKYDPLLTQIKLDSKEMLEGMSYIFRLSDGSFFLVDGGWPEQNHSEADKLYNLLLEQVDGGEIVIRGWLITHCHSDHIGTFNDFVEQYHDKVTINQLIYNFPTEEDIKHSDSPHMLDNHLGRYTKFKSVVKNYLKNTDIVKVHSGYKFSYADAEIEILQTLEDFYPKTIRNGGMNLSCLIFTVTVADQRILFLADATEAINDKLVKNFGSWLKSDMMQVAHHGVSGGTVAVYKLIDAEYILYPAPVSFYEDTVDFVDNKYFLFESKTVRQVFTMGFGQFTLNLPYISEKDAERIPGNIF